MTGPCGGEAIRALVKRYRPHHLYNLGGARIERPAFDDVVATTRINGLARCPHVGGDTNESAQTALSGVQQRVFAKAAQSPQNELTPCAP